MRASQRTPKAPPQQPPGIAARILAASLVEAVVEGGAALSEDAAPDEHRRLPPPERARALALAAEVLRHLPAIDWVLGGFLRSRPAGRAGTALRIAAAELLVEGVPPHAAVDGAVRVTRADPKAARLAPLVNAVGRRLAAEGAARWAEAPPPRLPPWIEAPVAGAWGIGAAKAIAAAHRERPPLDLTLRRPDEAADWADRLGGEVLPTGGLRLRGPRIGAISSLAGFAEGAWWVQDAAASLPALMLAPGPGECVLDACAAPGGKTLQLAAAGAAVTALDISPERLGRLRENLQRTGLTAAVVAADALAWEPEAPFDAVLLDAPCSATGTIRRHPDLPYRRGRAEVAPLLALQAALLDRAWSWLRPGGRLVYATCSLLPEEGEAQAEAFVARQPDARRREAERVPLEWRDAAGALRTRPDAWPERGGLDGFYAVLLEKARA